jgi:hypothetical protein
MKATSHVAHFAPQVVGLFCLQEGGFLPLEVLFPIFGTCNVDPTVTISGLSHGEGRFTG